MTHFSKILWLLGEEADDQRALSTVQRLATGDGVLIKAVRLLSETGLQQMTTLFGKAGESLAEKAVDHVTEEIQEFLTSHGLFSSVYQPQVLSGRGHQVVLEEVLREGIDLVVVARRSDQSHQPLAQKLLRKCPCPLLLLAGDPTEFAGPVLVPLDVAESGGAHHALNKKLLRYADLFAGYWQKPIHYLHSWRLEFELMLHGPRFNVHAEEIFEVQRRIKKARKRALLDLLAETGREVAPRAVHVHEGELTQILEEHLEQLESGVIVMGTVARTGIPGLVIGNSAEKVLSRLHCTVLAIKPDDFQPPTVVEH